MSACICGRPKGSHDLADPEIPTPKEQAANKRALQRWIQKVLKPFLGQRMDEDLLKRMLAKIKKELGLYYSLATQIEYDSDRDLLTVAGSAGRLSVPMAIRSKKGSSK